ncbi:MAG: N-acetyl-gamma-glutamyl-phosphate reductase, partial [Methylococcales bacterium]
MIKAGIVGGTGYTGVELLRILCGHPDVEIRAVTSRSDVGVKVSDVYPNLRGRIDVPFKPPAVKVLADCDVVFFATPNGTAMRMARELLNRDIKIIDLAADFRLSDPVLWEEWYGEAHACPELLSEAVYGLTEVNRSSIREARLIACPGCYPTAVQLGFLPLIEAHAIDLSSLIADAKSGVSGAGRKAQLSSLMAEAGEGLKAYSVPGHRHLPEIVQGLERASGQKVALTFVP